MYYLKFKDQDIPNISNTIQFYNLSLSFTMTLLLLRCWLHIRHIENLFETT